MYMCMGVCALGSARVHVHEYVCARAGRQIGACTCSCVRARARVRVCVYVRPCALDLIWLLNNMSKKRRTLCDEYE